jgi:hypothetical protein
MIKSLFCVGRKRRAFYGKSEVLPVALDSPTPAGGHTRLENKDDLLRCWLTW